jgi:hypothetical protein
MAETILPEDARIPANAKMLKKPKEYTIALPPVVAGAWLPYPTVVMIVNQDQAVVVR